VADLHDQHDKLLILDVADDAVVADAIASVAAKGVAFECCAELTRVFMCRQTTFQVGNDPRGIP
jgi:hypothetical protein